MSTNDQILEQEEPTVPSVIDWRAFSIKGIFAILLVHFFYFASPVLIPITLALLLGTMLTTLQRGLRRFKIPQAVSAVVIVLSLTGGVFATIYAMATPAQSWLQKVPSSFYRLETNLRSIMQPIQEIKDATDKLEEATKLEGDDKQVTEVRIRNPAVSDAVINGTTQILVSIGIVIILVLFFLLNGDGFLRKLVGVIPTLSDKKLAVEIVRSIQQDISVYLFTLTLLNLALGVIMGIVCALLGFENPILWGGLTALLSFAPYAGSSMTAFILTVVGLTTFDTLFMALAAPGIFLVLMFIYGNLLIPMTLGNRLSLNPVAIFLAIVFWGWMWGIAGALLAVPILACVKIVCDRFEALQPFAEFLAP